MNEDEFQRDIERPFRRYLDSHQKLLAMLVGAAATGVSANGVAKAGGSKEEMAKAMAAAWKRAHDVFGIETPWEALPEEVQAHRPETTREESKGE